MIKVLIRPCFNFPDELPTLSMSSLCVNTLRSIFVCKARRTDSSNYRTLWRLWFKSEFLKRSILKDNLHGLISLFHCIYTLPIKGFLMCSTLISKFNKNLSSSPLTMNQKRTLFVSWWTIHQIHFLQCRLQFHHHILNLHSYLIKKQQIKLFQTWWCPLFEFCRSILGENLRFYHFLFIS